MMMEIKSKFFFSSRRRHTRWNCDWSSDVCSSDLERGRSEQEWMPVSAERRESLGQVHRLRFTREIAEVKAAGRGFRGEHCLMLVLARPGEPTRIGFVASKKSVGGA